MRFSLHTLALRSLALVSLTFIGAEAMAERPVSFANQSVHLPSEADSLGAPISPRVSGLGPVTDGWITSAGGLASVHIAFDRLIEVGPGAVRAFNTPGDEIPNTSFSIEGAGDEILLAFNPPVTLGRVRVVLDYEQITSAGAPLDGEIANPASPSFPSGNGLPGGEAVVLFNVISGDANRDGVVDAEDAQLILDSLGQSEGDDGYDPNTDFNRDGVVNVLDVAAWTLGNGDALPVADGTPPVAELLAPDPLSGAMGGANEIVIGFSEPVSSGAISETTLTLLNESGDLQEIDDATLVSPMQLLFDLDESLLNGVRYTASISNGVADLSGELLDASKAMFEIGPPSTDSIFPPRTFPVGFGPTFAAEGDMNNDGLTDFVVSNTVDDTVSVLLGRGDGTFQPQIVSFAGDMPRGLTLGDYDDDGNLDAAVALEGEGALLVMYGDGAGNLGQNGAIAAAVIGGAPISVASGLLDGDTIPDIAVVNPPLGLVSVFLPRANRTLATAPDVQTGGDPSAAAIGELTGDTLLDLAVTDFTASTITVYEGLGGGEFIAPVRGTVSFPTGEGPVFAGVGDLDSDKDFDLFTANFTEGSLSIFLNNGVGTRGANFGEQTVGVGDGSVYAGVGDLDSDKDFDLASADSASDTITPVEQGPAGEFMATSAFDSGDTPVFVTITDLNNDGENDVVTVIARDGMERRGALVVRLGGSDESIEGQRQFETPENPSVLAIADVRGTPDADLLVGGQDEARGLVPAIVIQDGDGDGFFGPGDQFSLPADAIDIEVGDVIGGSENEIVVSVGGKANEVLVYEDSGKGFFSDVSLGNRGRIVIGDALPEFAGAEVVGAPTSFFAGQDIEIFNLFNGIFRGDPANADAFVDVGAGFVLDIALEDMNDDQLLDIVAVGANGVFAPDVISRGTFDIGVAVFLAESIEGETQFNEVRRVDLPDDISPLAVTTGDVNGDTIPDVIVAANRFIPARGGSGNIGSVFVIERGTETFLEEPQQIIVGERVGGVVAEDFTNDGLADLAVTSVLDDEVAVFVSGGAGFFPPQLFETHVAPGPLEARDVNDDGAMDLAILNTGSDDVTLLLGQSSVVQDEFNELDFAIDAMTANLIPTSRGSVAFDSSFSGTLELTADTSGNTQLTGVRIDGETQDIGNFLIDADVTIELVDGEVVGGSLSATISAGSRGTLDTYTADLAVNGQIREQGGGLFSIDGLTLDGDFDAEIFGGIDVTDWTEDAPLQGAFVITMLNPDGGFDPDVDLVVFVVEPSVP